jgi:ATP-dependent Zn protease
MYTEKIKLHDTVKNNDSYLNKLSDMTAGLTGADIANICNQAVGRFMQRDLVEEEVGVIEEDVEVIEGSDEKKGMKFIEVTSADPNDGVTFDDLEKSIDIVMIGMEKPERKMSEKERKIVSIHEAGHTLVASVIKQTDPPIKVSIIPRGKSALGFSQQEPTDQKLFTKKELFGKLCVLMGGRVAEEIEFDHLSTGASDDIEKLTKMAYNMVVSYGMSKEVGLINSYLNNDGGYTSDNTRENVDKTVKNILDEAYNYTKELLNNNKDHLHKLANRLYDKEVLVRDDIDDLLKDIKDTIKL